MYRYTQVGCEFLLLQLTSHIEKNTPLISQLLEESIRTSFQTSLDPEPSFPCMRDGPAACAYSSYQSRKRNQILLPPFAAFSLLLFPAPSIVISLHPWRVRAQDHRSRGLPLRPVSATRSSPSTQQSHGSSSTARLTVTVTSHWSSQPSPHWCV